MIEKQNKIQLVEIDKLKIKQDQLMKEISELQMKFENEKNKYSEFEELSIIWKELCNLNFDNKQYIENLCGGFDIYSTLSLGREDGKIEQLWSYIRDHAINTNENKKEISCLRKFFEFCLKVANSIKLDDEKFILFDIETNSDFDMETCIRTADSKQIGIVKKNIMSGVRIGDRIKYKAIVKVE